MIDCTLPSPRLRALDSDVGAVVVILKLRVVQLADRVLHVIPSRWKKEVDEIFILKGKAKSSHGTVL